MYPNILSVNAGSEPVHNVNYGFAPLDPLYILGRETRGGGPLLTVETTEKGDSMNTNET